MKNIPTRFAALGIAVLLPLGLASCGGSDEPAAGESVSESGSESGDAAGTVEEGASTAPEECRDAFPMAMVMPDLADVAMIPADFPEPPVDATLCQTSSTLEGNMESADYATDASAEEVLAAYETALAPYGAARSEDGMGRPMIAGEADGGVFIQVTPKDGGFSLVFAKA